MCVYVCVCSAVSFTVVAPVVVVVVMRKAKVLRAASVSWKFN